MLRITTMFQNKMTSSNLIFKDKMNNGVNLIYMPELGNSGINFINKYRKKGYWDYTIIPMAFSFMSHKIQTTEYYKHFKREIPTIRIQRKFAKNNSDQKTVVIDLTSLSESFAAFAKSRSKKQTISAFIKLVEMFTTDNKLTEKPIYLVIDGNNTDEREIIDSLHYLSRLESNKLRISNLDGILTYGNKRFWPLTLKDSDKDGPYLKVNINIITRYLKEVFNQEATVEEETPQESIENTKNIVKMLYGLLHKNSTSKTTINSDGSAKRNEDIEENPLEMIKNEVQRNNHIKGKTFEEKLNNLFKHKSPNDKNGDNKEDKKTLSLISGISKELKKLNNQYNGVIKITDDNISRNTNQFFNSINIIGFEDFHSYDKQKNEFGKNLDQSIFDLIKSIEKDPELDIKVLSIRTEVTDTNRDRLKTYKVKLKQAFGHTKPYIVSFHVPIPSKGKYLKLGGNDWIMINQFSPKPVVKISPKMVRVYTQFSKAALHLKHHSLNEESDVKHVFEDFTKNLKRTKKISKPPQVLTGVESQQIIDKYGLPEFTNSGIFVNFEVEAKK